MIFILNTKLQKNNRLIKALSKILGLGKNNLTLLEKEFGITKQMMVKQLRIFLKKKLSNYINKKFIYGQNLKLKLLSREIKLRNLKNYKSMRKRLNLPQRGQRTHTNARTIKNAKK